MLDSVAFSASGIAARRQPRGVIGAKAHLVLDVGIDGVHRKALLKKSPPRSTCHRRSSRCNARSRRTGRSRRRGNCNADSPHISPQCSAARFRSTGAGHFAGPADRREGVGAAHRIVGVDAVKRQGVLAADGQRAVGVVADADVKPTELSHCPARLELAFALWNGSGVCVFWTSRPARSTAAANRGRSPVATSPTNDQP